MSDEAPALIPLRHAELIREKWLRVLDRLAALPLLPAVAIPVVLALLSQWPDAAWVGVGLSWLAMTFMPLTLMSAALVAWLAASRRGKTARFEADAVVLDPDGDALSVPIDDITLAWAVRGDRLEAFTRGGDRLWIDLPESTPVAPLVDRLRGRIDRGRAYTLPLEGRVARTLRKVLFWSVPMAVSALPFVWGWEVLPVSLAGFGLAYVGAKGTARIRFGADGFEVLGRLRSRYFAFRDVAKVKHEAGLAAHRVRVVLDSGDEVVIAARLSEQLARLLTSLITEGTLMVASGAEAGAHVPSLDRRGEDEGAWRARVMKAAGGGDYRGPALDAARLLALMKNPAADPDQRVAAALALRRSPGGTARIRVAAEVSTDPEVRSALDALAEEEIDERRVKRALAALAR